MISNLAFSNLVSTNNLGSQNAVSNQQAVNEIGISVLAKGSNTISNLGPMEARSSVEILTNNELAETIADLKATLQAFHNNGIKINKKGQVVVTQGTTIIIPGVFTKESIKATITDIGIEVVVNAS